MTMDVSTAREMDRPARTEDSSRTEREKEREKEET
jgi:hypothetical protein